jgi:hypothetical protein
MIDSSNLKPINKNIDIAFLLIVLTALMLRLWGTWNVSTSDEYNEVIEALRVASGHLNFERWIKRVYLYILAGEFGFYYIGGRILGAFLNPMDFAEKIIRNMEPLFIMGRITSAIAGAYTVGMTYRIGKRYFNRHIGIIASVLLCITVFHVDLSQQAKVDALLGALTITVFYFLFKLLAPHLTSILGWGWCGFFFALTVQTKPNTIVLIVPVVVTFLLTSRKAQNKLRIVSTFFFGGLAGFILGNPPVILAPFKFLGNILGYGTQVYTTPVNAVPSEMIGFIAYPLFYLQTFGWPISLLTVAAIVYTLLNLNAQRIVMLSFIAVFYVEMGSLTSLVGSYYLIPALPLILLLVGEFTNQVYHTYYKEPGLSSKIWVKISLLVAVLFSLLYPLSNLAYHEISLFGRNTRYLAKDWIESNIPSDSKILMDSGKSINSFSPPIAENKASLQRILWGANENINSGKIVHGMVDTNALIYYELLLQTIPAISYDITSTMYGLELKSIDEYINKGYQYFVISKDMKEKRINEYSSIHFSKTAEFYKALDIDRRISLIKSIGPTIINGGDTFLVYRVSGD